MLIFCFAVSLAAVVFLLLYGLIEKKIRPQSQIHQRILRIQDDADKKGEDYRQKDKERKLSDIPFVERVVQPFLRGLVQTVTRLAPREMNQVIAARIAMAGKAKEWSVNEFILSCMLGAAAMWAMMFILTWHANYALIQKIMFMVLGGLFGGSMPILMMNIMIQKRQEAIQHQLPEVLDLLCVSVQAGLSFDASMRKIIDRMKGPFVDECRRMQEDIRMGMVRRTAMHNVSKRCKVQDVSLFMTSLIQAERLGTSMGQTLKNQADNIRERRRQYVKAQAMKAPVKIIFPLVIFIFPALFVVALVPSLLSLLKNL